MTQRRQHNRSAPPAGEDMGWLQLTITCRDSTRRLNKALHDQGWIQMQPRLWMRAGVRFGLQCQHIGRLRDYVPCAATLRFLWLTCRQWTGQVTLIGANYPNESPAAVVAYRSDDGEIPQPTAVMGASL